MTQDKNIPLIVAGIAIILAFIYLRSEQLVGGLLSSLIGVGGLVVMLAGFGVSWTRGHDRARKAQAKKALLGNPRQCSRLIVLATKRVISRLESREKLTKEESSQLFFTTLSLMYLLVDRGAHISMSKMERVKFSDALQIEIGDYLTEDLKLSATQKSYVMKIIDETLVGLGPYASRLLPDEGDNYRGTLFWEYSRLAEKCTNAKISQLDVMMSATEMGAKVIESLNSEHQSGSAKSLRKKTTLKTIVVVIVVVIGVAWISDLSNSRARCKSELARLKESVESSEKYMSETKQRAKYSNVAVEYYNKHVPTHNEYVRNYNNKLAECR